MDNEIKCTVCGAGESKTCGGCGTVAYCSVDHQRQDWTTHKKSCFPFLIKPLNEVLAQEGHSPSPKSSNSKSSTDNCWVSTRDLTAGAIIFEEKPIFHIPSVNFSPKPKGEGQPEKYSQIVQVDDRGGILHDFDRFCLSCGLLLSKFTARSCNKCGWPVCSEKCEKHGVHVENECKIFTLEKKEFSTFSPPAALQLVVMTRISEMRIHKPAVWKLLMSLENLPISPFFPPPNSQSDSTPMDEAKFHVMMQSMTQDFKNVRLVCRLKGFCLDSVDFSRDSGIPGSKRSGFFVYGKSGYLNHSCSPNCLWSIGPAPDFKIRIRAGTAIKKGEILTVSHVFGHPGERYGTFGRQKIILDRFGFLCQCPLCGDPSELNSLSSAIICTCKSISVSSPDKGVLENTTSESGVFLPFQKQNPINNKPPSDPQMKCGVCGKIEKLSTFQPDLEEIAQLIAAQEEKVNRTIPNEQNIAASIKFLRDLSQTYVHSFLHPNHWLIQWATRVSLQGFKFLLLDKASSSELGNYGKRVTSVGESQMNECMKKAKYLLEIEEKICPGLSFFKAELSHLMSVALLGILQNIKNSLSNKSRLRLPLLGIEKQFIYYRKFQSDSLAFYKTEIPFISTSAGAAGEKKGSKTHRTADKLKQEEEFANELEAQIKLHYTNDQE